jgi:SnoaL-like domain
MTKRDIAFAFSSGNFEQAAPHLTNDVEWVVIGEATFSGKQAVVEQGEKIAAYFKSVETDFKTTQVLETQNEVIITGTAEFFRDGNSINFTSACDVYEFDDNSKLAKIASYCIVHKR